MLYLPIEIIEEIVDIVAVCHPESLADCALVSFQWHARSTYHLYRIFRTPTITTFGALHAFAGIVEKQPRLASIAVSLGIAPDLKLNSAFGSYIPFHHLSSSVLPNVQQLFLGETLRWSDYPLLYRNGTVGFSFPGVTALDLSCHFNSISDLAQAMRSFRNVTKVRLRYSHHYPPSWMFPHNDISRPRRVGPFPKPFKLENLELPLAIWRPVVDVCGDFVVNLAILCPQTFAGIETIEGGKPVALMRSSLASLQTVKITVLMEDSRDMDHARLRRLGPLLIDSINKHGILFSLFLCCLWHPSRERYRVAYDVTATQLRKLIQKFADERPNMHDCPECHTNTREALLVGINYATNRNLIENGFGVLRSVRKDMTNLRNLLTDQYGYRDEDITTLIDSEDEPYESQPTRENIIRGMENLVAGKRAGDHIVFAFSGHGGQVTALIEGGEADGLDEVLLPIDCTFDLEVPNNFGRFIRDNDIRDILVNRLAAGVRCTMIFDCSHSGTMADLPCVVTSPIAVSTPELPFFSPRKTARRMQRSFARMNTQHDGHVDMWSSNDSSSSKSEVTSWSACLDEELTFENKSGGIFIKAFTQILNSTPHPTNKELLRELRTSMLKVTQKRNQKLARRRQVEGISSRGSDDLEDYVAPRPQLGSLRPESSLHDIFTL